MTTGRNITRPEAAARAQHLIAQASHAALGTLVPDTGGPYVSLVAMACRGDGRPVLLLSALAAHSRHLAASDKVSLLVEGGSRTADLDQPRLTLTGRAIRLDEPGQAKTAFIARHPDMADYDVALDFSYYVVEPDAGRYIEGFGAIWSFEANELAMADRP